MVLVEPPIEEVNRLAGLLLGQPTRCTRIADGENATAYFADTSNDSLVLRLSDHDQHFRRDLLAHQNFAHYVPIPKVLLLTETDLGWAAVSERVPGTMTDKLSRPDLQTVAPEILATMDRIHQADISAFAGHGIWDPRTGRGEYDTAQAAAGGGISSWNDLDHQLRGAISATGSRSAYVRLYGDVTELLDGVPEQRCLVHGDYGFNNLLVMRDRVSGVIDWGLSSYGDPIRDLAWLTFWADDFDFAAAYRGCSGNMTKSARFEERLAAFQARLGLENAVWYATRADTRGIRWSLQRALTLLGGSPLQLSQGRDLGAA